MPTLPTQFMTLVSNLTAQVPGLTGPVAAIVVVTGSLLYLAADEAAAVRQPAQRVLGLGLGSLLALGLAQGVAHLLLRLTSGA